MERFRGSLKIGQLAILAELKVSVPIYVWSSGNLVLRANVLVSSYALVLKVLGKHMRPLLLSPLS